MSAIATHEDLTELDAFVEHEVARGRYRNREEAIAEAVRLLRKREQKLASLRAEIQVAIEQSSRGEGTVIDGVESADAFFDKIRSDALAEMTPRS